jgi:succinoglycan biosynthesis protein ExoA
LLGGSTFGPARPGPWVEGGVNSPDFGETPEAAWPERLASPASRSRAGESRSFAFDAAEDSALQTERAFAVIPCLNEASHIEALIRHLLADSAWRDPLIVVADGGSTDGTVDIVERMAATDRRVRLIENPRRLQSCGVNMAAARFGRGRRWMVRVDAHAGYPADYVSNLLAEALRTGAASVVVGMNTVGQGGFQTAAATAQNSVLGAGGSAHRCGGKADWVDHGHHALFDLDAFFGVGGYDESFGANEDAEYDIRLARSGGRVWLTDAVQVEYYPRTTAHALFRQYVNYGKGRARTLVRHRLKPKLRQLLPVGVAPALLLAPFGLIWPVLALPAVLWAIGCLALGVLLGLKTKRPEALAAGWAAMVMHLAWSVGFWTQVLTRHHAGAPEPQPIPLETLEALHS